MELSESGQGNVFLAEWSELITDEPLVGLGWGEIEWGNKSFSYLGLRLREGKLSGSGEIKGSWLV